MGMENITPQSGIDSRQRIQTLWEFIQRDIVELESETDQPPEQIWFDFINGDMVNGTQFFKDFLELYYITKPKINVKSDQDVTQLINRIAAWRDAVKVENMTGDKRSPTKMNIISQGIKLFREYESVLIGNQFVQIINQTANLR